MKLREFKKQVNEKYDDLGQPIHFESNEIEFRAHIGDSMVCQSGPYHSNIKEFWMGRLVGSF